MTGLYQKNDYLQMRIELSTVSFFIASFAYLLVIWGESEELRYSDKSETLSPQLGNDICYTCYTRLVDIMHDEDIPIFCVRYARYIAYYAMCLPVSSIDRPQSEWHGYISEDPSIGRSVWRTKCPWVFSDSPIDRLICSVELISNLPGSQLGECCM
jgi:hypothetical protein